jgi:hypothetical protein
MRYLGMVFKYVKMYYEMNFTCKSNKTTIFDLWFAGFTFWLVKNKAFYRAYYAYRPCLNYCKMVHKWDYLKVKENPLGGMKDPQNLL